MVLRRSERADRLRARPGRLGRWCGSLEHTCDNLHRTERHSAAFARRLGARMVRLFFDFLVLVLIGLAELDTLRRRAGNALVDRDPKR